MDRVICHVCLVVEELEKSADFYQQALGLEKLAEIDCPDAVLYWMGQRTQDGISSFVELRREKNGAKTGTQADRVNHFSIVTTEFARRKEQHRQMGIIDVEIPNGPYFIHDVNGYSIEIMSPEIVAGLLDQTGKRWEIL